MPFYAGARSMGMGGAGTALGFESSAVYWNPALLGDMGESDLTGSFSRDAFDTAYSFAAFGQPVRDFGGIAAGWAHTENVFERTDDWGRSFGSDNVSANAFMLGAGYYRDLPVSFGATVKYIDESIGSFNVSGMGVDGGMLFDIQPIRFALVWENLLSTGFSGTSITGSAVSETMPSNLRLGGALYGQNAGDTGFRYTIAADVLVPLDGLREVAVSPGVEGWLGQSIGLRAGMREMRDGTVGLSLRAGGMRLDYALILSGTIENNHIFSTSFFF